MPKNGLSPWHKVVSVREDVKTGELTLAQFAADLYDVQMQKARPIYQDPREFFALTYPTLSLRELAKGVILRLAAKSEKAVRSLKLTYGGGKTHSLVALYHLMSDPDNLPDLPAVQEFVETAGLRPPKARVVVLSFDKLDVDKGMEVRGPKGETRWLKHPWSVIAWQVAGAEGLKMLRQDRKEDERDTAPAENLLSALLEIPRKKDEATLLLLDELLMYVRSKVRQDAAWRGALLDFFQCLTQAVTKSDRTAMVASILDTELYYKREPLGGELAQQLHVIFHRQGEEDVEPVGKEDVAEVLRRRFFTPDSVKDAQKFRPHVVAALQGIKDLDETVRKNTKGEEERFLRAFPFHPDLTEVLYSKWTQIGGFQPTRGVLRTFAVALRDAEKWDRGALIGPNVFLSAPDTADLCPAAMELAGIAQRDEYEGRQHDWAAILKGEIQKAREIQSAFPSLKGRELEQVVMATFLHSQPVNQKAALRDLLLLIGSSRPDRIEIGKGLQRWTEESWFLDDTVLNQDRVSAADVPKHWRLGTRPNLNQMHRDARSRVAGNMIEERLEKQVRVIKELAAGAGPGGDGVHVHMLPGKPSSIDDDGEFHYAVLGPKAASDPGKPSAEARRFLEEKTGPDNPRVRKNLVVLAVPSTEGIEMARDRIRDYLGWIELASLPEVKAFDELRKEHLEQETNRALGKIKDSIVQAYCIAIVQGEDGSTKAYRVSGVEEGLFAAIKKDRRLHILEAAINAEALLPGGAYDLWKPGETSRRVKDLADTFAQDPRLPKMLRKQEIFETLKIGARDGHLVLRAKRPDGSPLTVWRAEAPGLDLASPDAEIVLLESAELAELPISLLVPGALPGLWPQEQGTLKVGDVFRFFDGAHEVKVKRNSHSESLRVPRAPRGVVEAAVREAVRGGLVWLTAGSASLFREEVPPGVLTDDAVLSPPPAPIPLSDLAMESLPAAWKQGLATASSLAGALSKKVGKVLPWAVVRDAIDGALRGRMLERSAESGPWPCEWAGAQNVRLCLPKEPPPPSAPPVAPGQKTYVAEAELSAGEMQNLGEHIGGLQKAAAGLNLHVTVKVQVAAKTALSEETIKDVNDELRKVSKKLSLK
jgi:hypothetical protein